MATKKKSKVIQITDDAYFLEGAGAVVTYTKSAPRGEPPRAPAYGSTWKQYNFGKGKNWVPWYDEDNAFPQNLVSTVFGNNINPGILMTKADFISGQRVITYQRSIVDGKSKLDLVSIPEVDDWLQANDADEYMLRASTDYVFFGNVFSEFIYNRTGQIVRLNHLDSTLCRSGYKSKSDGLVKTMYISTAWRPQYNGRGPVYDPSKPKNNTVVMVPAYDRTHPTKYPKCIMHNKRYLPGYPYYSPPEWIGNLNWIKLASEIPLWHFSGMKNGYNMRWHIEIPRTYFDQYGARARQMEDETRVNMNNWLAGSENVGKAFVSKYGINGTLPEGWKITPLKAELSDEAYTALFEQSNSAIISGHGIDPTLAGVETAGRLSSGSEKRISYYIYLALKTPAPRKVLLKPFYEIKRANNWPKNLEFGIENTEITKLDENPTSVQQTTSA